MKFGKRPKLPRGLRWNPKSPHIYFSWRDQRGRQHQQSTDTADPAEALAFKLQFLKERPNTPAEPREQLRDQSRLPLWTASGLYFTWKGATNASGTVRRERHMFKQVEKYFGAKTELRQIDLQFLREYQQERRKQISPTMRKPVSARTVNYELRLLRGVMKFVNCWK